MVKRVRPSTTRLVTIASFLLIGYFLWTLVSTYAAVVRVEATYQLRKIATTLQSQTLRELLLPQLATAHLGTNERTQEFGISIPALYLAEPVIFNVDPADEVAYTAALTQGIAHAAGTGLPGDGSLGYYFAHSSSQEMMNQYNAVFYLLGKLEPGNEIYIWHRGERYRYTMSHSAITEPNDVSFLNHSNTSERVVLQTCWPPGTTSKRLLVFADRTD